MSGIYGIYRHDGGPVDPAWMDGMRAAMAYYGPDGGGSSIDGSLGLGHLLLAVNPEDALEKQPVVGGRGLIVSAARLDNREELLQEFGLPSAEASQWSDGHLVSMAFDRWGTELCSHLQGDWSLAAWDRSARKLLLARDAVGSASLYYYHGKGFIAFATSVKALLALPGVAKEPDALRLAQVLVSWQNDAERSAYKGIERLVWAQLMVVSADGQCRKALHWSPMGRETLHYRRDEEYDEAFLEHYNRAVKSCLRAQTPIAATLSGGRDSGSVVALAGPLLAGQNRTLTTYTSVPYFAPDGAGARRVGDEWELAQATAALAGSSVRPVAVDAAHYGVLQGIEYFLAVHDGPSHAAGNHYWLQAIGEVAARDGARAMLTGQLGNATVSWSGNGLALPELWRGSQRSALQLFLHAEQNPWQALKRQVAKPLVQPTLLKLRRLLAAGRSPWRDYSALHPGIAAELKLDEQMRAAGHDATFAISPWEDLHLRFFRPSFCIGPSLVAEMGFRNSLATLDPTVNVSLTEFLLRVPDAQFRRNGRSSFLLQRAFRGRLPEQVLAGRHKGLQAADLGHRILRELPAMRRCLEKLEALPTAREFLDLPLMRKSLNDLVQCINVETTAKAGNTLLRGIGVGLFLRDLAK